MLDNMGLGEFFFLALLALLFFGPKQLPQIGAKLGRWIRSLTQYSSAFLNEWRDEALAVHDAVQEVKGIRDEIVSARAEIAGTLQSARTEMGDAVSGATRDVQEQVKRSAQVLPETGPPPKPPTEEGTGTDAAIARTQAILDRLHKEQVGADVPPLRSELSKNAPKVPSVETPQAAGTTLAPRCPAELDASDGCSAGVPALPQVPIDGAQIETLRGQVDLLRTEMQELQAELGQIRDRIEARVARERADTVEKEMALAGEAI
jgi:Sec-independent protein translocase protein TatA